MPATIDKKSFETIYAQRPPWDIDGPQQPFRDLAGKLEGSLLDVGCGSGENALFFASLGLKVVGIDFLQTPIDQAIGKARQRGLGADFVAKDALSLRSWDRRFDNAIDSGLFHVFSDEDRALYVQGLEKVLSKGGRLFLLCFSDRTPGTQGPRRVTKAELTATFATGWILESIEDVRFQVRPEFQARMFGGVAPEAWFLSAKRTP